MEPNRYYYHVVSDVILVMIKPVDMDNIATCRVVKGSGRCRTGCLYHADINNLIPDDYEPTENDHGD